MKKYLLFVLFVLSGFALTAQKIRDIVYIKGGIVVKGFITEQVPNEYVKIRSGRNLFVFEENKIVNIEKENPFLIYEEIDRPFFLNKGIGVDFAGLGLGIHYFPFNRNLGLGVDIGTGFFVVYGFTGSIYYRIFLKNITNRIVPYVGGAYTAIGSLVGNSSEHISLKLGFDFKMRDGNYLSFGINLSFFRKVYDDSAYEIVIGTDGYKRARVIEPAFKSGRVYFLPSITYKINK